MAPRRSPRTVPLLAAVWLGVLGSCGGGGAPPAPQVPVAATALPPAAAPPPPPDLTPVADPARLVVSGRLAKPGASLAVIRGWAPLPLLQADAVTELLGEPLGALVDLDDPVDFAVTVDGAGMRLQGSFAVSAGMKDADRAKAVLGEKYTLVPGANGALLIQGLGRSGGSQSDSDADDRACEIAPAYGTPSTRLVCAGDTRALAALGPWLTRTAARTPIDNDLRLDLRLGPLRPTLQAVRRMGGALLGSLLGRGGDRRAVTALATELLDFAIDLDVATLAIDLAEPAATAKVALRFVGTESTLTRVALAHPDFGSPAPSVFWQLPADADMAFFERGVEPGDLGKTVRLAVDLAGDTLADVGLKEADRKVLLDAVAKLASPAPLAYASGLDPAPADTATDAGKRPPAKDTTLAHALIGWHLVAVDEPPDRLAAALRELSAALARPGTVAAFAARDKGAAAPALRPLPLPRVPLPKGSLHYAAELPLPRDRGDAAAKADPARRRVLALHLVMVPDGTRTWVGIGGDAAAVASKLSSTLGAAANPRSDLAPIDRAPVGAAGFLDVRSLPEAVAEVASVGGDPSLFEAVSTVLKGIETLPHRGRVPVVFSLTAQPGNVAVAALQVPRGAIEDAVMGAVSLARP